MPQVEADWFGDADVFAVFLRFAFYASDEGADGGESQYLPFGAADGGELYEAARALPDVVDADDADVFGDAVAQAQQAVHDVDGHGVAGGAEGLRQFAGAGEAFDEAVQVGAVELFEVDDAAGEGVAVLAFRFVECFAKAGEAVGEGADARVGTYPEDVAVTKGDEVGKRLAAGVVVVDFDVVAGALVAAVEADVRDVGFAQAGDDGVVEQGAGEDDAVGFVGEGGVIDGLRVVGFDEVDVDAVAGAGGVVDDFCGGVHEEGVVQGAGDEGEGLAFLAHEAAGVGVGDVVERGDGGFYFCPGVRADFVGGVEYPRDGGLRYAGFFGDVF